MKLNAKVSLIFLLHLLESLESKPTANIPFPRAIEHLGHGHPSAIFNQKNVDAVAVASKHVPTKVAKHTESGQSAEGSKKSRHAEHHDESEKEKGSKGSHHKSSEDGVSAKKGSDTKESHNKEYDEEAGHDKKTEDEAHESSFDEDGDHKVYSSEHKNANKHKVRKFEKGFFKTYHKKERNKKSNFFEDHHQGGDFKKFGQGKEKFYRKKSGNKAKNDGKTSSSSTFEDSKKKSKIK